MLTGREKHAHLKEHLAIIEKFEAEDKHRSRLPLNLSLNERDYIAQALRRLWLPKAELRAYRQQQKLKHIEVTKKIAKRGVRYGDRTEFVKKLTGYANILALKQFQRRARKRRR